LGGLVGRVFPYRFTPAEYDNMMETSDRTVLVDFTVLLFWKNLEGRSLLCTVTDPPVKQLNLCKTVMSFQNDASKTANTVKTVCSVG